MPVDAKQTQCAYGHCVYYTAYVCATLYIYQFSAQHPYNETAPYNELALAP